MKIIKINIHCVGHDTKYFILSMFKVLIHLMLYIPWCIYREHFNPPTPNSPNTHSYTYWWDAIQATFTKFHATNIDDNQKTWLYKKQHSTAHTLPIGQDIFLLWLRSLQAGTLEGAYVANKVLMLPLLSDHYTKGRPHRRSTSHQNVKNQAKTKTKNYLQRNKIKM